MESVKLFVLSDKNWYAVELPVNSPNDANFPKIIRTFEFLVKDIGKMEDYHKNPFESEISEEETRRRLNKYYYCHTGSPIAALFLMRHTAEMYKRMESFVEIVNISFQKGIFL